MTDNVKWPGASGRNYEYSIFEIGTPLKSVGGNYIFAKRNSQNLWIPVYIGQTQDLSDRFDNHHKAGCINRNGATHIHAHQNSTEQARLDEETDLLRNFSPPCNG